MLVNNIDKDTNQQPHMQFICTHIINDIVWQQFGRTYIMTKQNLRLKKHTQYLQQVYSKNNEPNRKHTTLSKAPEPLLASLLPLAMPGAPRSVRSLLVSTGQD